MKYEHLNVDIRNNNWYVLTIVIFTATLAIIFQNQCKKCSTDLISKYALKLEIYNKNKKSREVEIKLMAKG